MVICMAVVLSAAACCQDPPSYRRSLADEEGPRPVEGVAIGRLGVWTGRDFNFASTRTDGKLSTSKQEAFFSASVLGGIELYDHFLVLATIEGDVASKLSSELAGVYLGWHDRPKERYGKGVPDEATVYAGAIGGSLKVHETDFGDFDRGIGVGAGITLGWAMTRHLSFDLYGEYRYLRFDYKPEVMSGSRSIGGNTGWFGAGVSFRF
ncbi:MAG TPA: hypothetical protein VKW04_21565 [Planctomycetota bacterium]|nr:hypothetical protein [Planctomycetota bacterium]